MAVRVTDPFNDVTHWTQISAGIKSVTGKAVRGDGGGSDGFALYNADTPPTDHYAKLAWGGTANNSPGTDNDDAGPMVRMDGSANGYLFNVEPNDFGTPPGSNWILFKVVAGAGTPLTSGHTTVALVSGDIIECRAVGNTISGWINGVQITSTTDASFPTNTGYGVHIFSSTQVGTWDNFEGGDFTGGGGGGIVVTATNMASPPFFKHRRRHGKRS